jgi:hypothetical protein
MPLFTAAAAVVGLVTSAVGFFKQRSAAKKARAADQQRIAQEKQLLNLERQRDAQKAAQLRRRAIREQAIAAGQVLNRGANTQGGVGESSSFARSISTSLNDRAARLGAISATQDTANQIAGINQSLFDSQSAKNSALGDAAAGAQLMNVGRQIVGSSGQFGSNVKSLFGLARSVT